MANSIAPENNRYNTFAGQFKAFGSLNFGQLVPQMCHELLSRDSWRVGMSTALEIAPLACKTFADIFYNQAAFYVGLNQLDKDYSSVRSGMTFRKGRGIKSLAHMNANALICTFLKEIYFNPQTMQFGYDTAIASGSRSLVDYNKTFADFTKDSLEGLIQKYRVKEFKWDKTGDARVDQKNVTKWLRENYPTADLFVMSNIHTRISGDDNHMIHYILPIYLNERGSFIRKIFNGLGYQLFNPVLSSTGAVLRSISAQYMDDRDYSVSYFDVNIVKEYINPYPALAYLKIYADYFLNASFVEGAYVSVYLENVYNHTNLDDVTVGNWDSVEDGDIPTLNPTPFVRCFEYLHLSLYKDDVTDATLNPMLPKHSLSGVGTLNQYTGHSVSSVLSQPSVNFNGNPNQSIYGAERNRFGSLGSTNQVPGFSQGNDLEPYVVDSYSSKTSGGQLRSYFSERLLMATAKFLMKSRLAGTKVADRLRVFFGLSEPFEDLRRCKRLGQRAIKLNISGMPIQSNTFNGVSVENQAGEKIGLASANGGFDFTFRNDFGDGIGIVVNWLNVKTIYLNRTHRLCLKDTLADYYNGSLDGQGFSQVKSLREVNSPTHGLNGNTIFGFEPLYEDYRRLSIDFISGDILRLPALRSYLLPRTFENEDAQQLIADQTNVLTTADVTDEYKSLFITQDGYDPILVCSDVQVVANRCICDSIHALGLDTGQINIDTLATEID